MYKEPQNQGNNVFLSGMAVLLSTLALLFSGFTIYQVFTWQQKVTASPPNLFSSNLSNSTTSVLPVGSPESKTTDDSGVQFGQFVQYAFRNKAHVELLKVNRIKGRDVVNVQFRVRLLTPDKTTYGTDIINPRGTTARNPETSETYVAVPEQATDSVTSFSMSMNKQTTVDGYVWLKVPEGVNTLNIYMTNTAAFQNVPISN